MFFAAVFHQAWKLWARKKGFSDRRPDVFTYESIQKECKQRMKNYLETRRERLLTRLGINGPKRVREYSVIGGGAAEEVSAIIAFSAVSI